MEPNGKYYPSSLTTRHIMKYRSGRFECSHAQIAALSSLEILTYETLQKNKGCGCSHLLGGDVCHAACCTKKLISSKENWVVSV